MPMIRLNAHGDTIVEVLLCVAVAGAVLAGAYVSANRSFAVSRQSQERAEALKVLETQVERLKVAARPDASWGSTPFCLNNTPTITAAGSAGCVAPADGRYQVTITRDGSTNNYSLKVVWDRFGGGTPQQLIIAYRANPL